MILLLKGAVSITGRLRITTPGPQAQRALLFGASMLLLYFGSAEDFGSKSPRRAAPAPAAVLQMLQPHPA